MPDYEPGTVPGGRIPDKYIKPDGTVKIVFRDGVASSPPDAARKDIEFCAHRPSAVEERQCLDALCEKMRGTDLVEQYRTNHRREWQPDASTGYTSMPVLPQFIGKKLDNSLVAYLHTLRPSSVRISADCVTCDSSPWRVTVFTKQVDGVEIIASISQEVCIGFSSGWNVSQMFQHIHEGKPMPGPFPRVVGDLSALSRADFK